MSAAIIGGSAALLGTGFKVYEGLKQDSQANQIQKGLRQPQYAIPQEFFQNREIAKQLAQIGLPSAAYNNNLNQINSNQATALDAAQRTANPAAAIGNIVSGTNTATSNLNAEDAQARQNNQRLYMQANDAIAGQKLAQQQANVFDPYTQKYNEMQAYRGAGLQNINSAIGDIGSLGALGVQYGLGNTNPQWTNPTQGQPPLTATGVQGVNPTLNNSIPFPTNPNVPQYTGWTQWG